MKTLFNAQQLSYQHGILHLERTNLKDLAVAEETPCYVYSSAALTQSFLDYQSAFRPDDLICYALKANPSLAILRTLGCLGAGADIVSGGELFFALKAGIPPHKIIFSGVGKSKEDLCFALSSHVKQINVESLSELKLLPSLSNHSIPIALRLNPDVDAKTHTHITTGKADSKFGLPLSDLEEALRFIKATPNLYLIGLSIHIGSQILSLDPYKAALLFLKDHFIQLKGQGFPLESLDVGGGLGIVYHNETPPPVHDFGDLAINLLGDLKTTLICEPGRSIVGNAGLLLTKVLYIKDTPQRRYVILDAGMNDKMRFALYQAYHHIVPVDEPSSALPINPVDLVGPVCESTDVFATARPMPPLKEGDILALCSAGAYSSCMASTYNLRPKIKELMINGETFEVTRRQQTIDDLFAYEQLPSWIRQ